MYLLRKGDEAGARRVLDRVLAANGAPDAAGRHPPGRAGSARHGAGRSAPNCATAASRSLRPGSWSRCPGYGVFVWLPSELVKGGMGFVRGHGFLVLLALAQIPGYALPPTGRG